MIDYRGFGDSTGTPSEAGLLLDARAAWDYVASHACGTGGKDASKEIILVGQSLGTGVVSALAGSLALESERRGISQIISDRRHLSPGARADRAVLVPPRADAGLHLVLGHSPIEAIEGVPGVAEWVSIPSGMVHPRHVRTPTDRQDASWARSKPSSTRRRVYWWVLWSLYCTSRTKLTNSKPGRPRSSCAQRTTRSSRTSTLKPSSTTSSAMLSESPWEALESRSKTTQAGAGFRAWVVRSRMAGMWSGGRVWRVGTTTLAGQRAPSTSSRTLLLFEQELEDT